MSALPFELPDLAPLLNADDLNGPPREEAPRMALDLIDEDPNQPRHEFDDEALQELADSIKTSGGVKSPVSLRPHPTDPGRYMLNFGARRLRASRMLGLPDIPYFIDRKVDSFDQVIENEQRSNLTTMELAMFVKARMDEGMALKDIAARLGKNKGLITKATALIDPPPVVMAAYRSGKVTGINEVYELRRMHSENPQAVEQWADHQPAITRTALAALREQLDAPAVQPEAATVVGQVANTEPTDPAPAKVATVAAVAPPVKPAPAPLVVIGEYKGQPLELDFSARPHAPGHFYGRRPGTTRRLTVPASEVRLVGFSE